MKSNHEKEEYIEVWEDVVHIKDLVLSLIICSVTTMGAYLLAPDDATKSLVFGLIGTVIGFIICSIIIKPKRTFEYVDEEE
ncbi:hypothetical protein FHP05_11045 [Cerasibacillus terrae]|uniref:Heme ABC transporter n=1 Tax=Cerasibacillus terrae TaxID=2498845 RepID=A0A5C8NS82_9BACI|nr:hypothetical protein [Cerasibacillus terrae]TXL63705.1 hypothetical protein FHP05_11045 [Cerasibacillus terrae]